MIPAPPRFDGPLRYGPLTLPSRFNLAPLAGYTGLPLRLSVRELGGLGLATTDLVNARAILEGKQKTMELLATCPAERPFAVQIFGAVPHEMTAAAQWLEARGVSSIDINMGCPVRKVVRSGGGSAMMCDTGGTTRLVKTIVDGVRIPVTVKMRLGWDDDNTSAPELARAFEDIGVAAVTIHGRTREQGFGGRVKLDGIRAVVEAVNRLPVIGNGDVRTIADAARMFAETGCAGIAIGRGALANPWIFRQLDSWLRTGDPGPRAAWTDRLEFMATHFRRLVEWRGEHLGCLQFRKVATWYCRSLRTGKEVQQTLIRLDSVAMFNEVVEGIRAHGEPPDWAERDVGDPQIPVPAGPISHW
ncbi:MAG: tRNA dihydrouridine synthase DusB [Gemmataceae bacterium]